MPVNQGTLIIAPVRPNDSSDDYPVAYANELLGGYHSVETINDRNNIAVERRLPGMLCTVYSDPITSNNETYILGSDLLTWTIYKPGGGTTSPTNPLLESQEGFIDEPLDTTYIIVPKARYPVSIKGLYLFLENGSLSLSLKINGVAINLGASSTLNVVNQPIDLALNSPLSINEELVIAITNSSSSSRLAFQIDYMRV